MPSSYYLDDFTIKNKRVFTCTLGIGCICYGMYIFYNIL